MKSLRIGIALSAAALLAWAPADAAAQPSGVDVSSYQGDVDWSGAAGAGVHFAYVKATEGTFYQNDYFASQYDGSYAQGLVRGAYHFALPDVSSGSDQADYFVDHGGGWSADNQTLPGALDIEYNPYGDTCYGLSADDMVAWLHGFADEYKARTGRDAVIYTTADWWNTCTAGNTDFGSTNPLWVADYGGGDPALPAGWGFYTFWQYTSTGAVAGIGGSVDQSVFNGDASRLLALANNTP